MVFGLCASSAKYASAGGQEEQLCDVNSSITVMEEDSALAACNEEGERVIASASAKSMKKCFMPIYSAALSKGYKTQCSGISMPWCMAALWAPNMAVSAARKK